jgi:transposase
MAHCRSTVPQPCERREVNGILWVLRTGTPWCDVPERYRKPISAVVRFSRWNKQGVPEAVFEA